MVGGFRLLSYWNVDGVIFRLTKNNESTSCALIGTSNIRLSSMHLFSALRSLCVTVLHPNRAYRIILYFLLIFGGPGLPYYK